MQGKEYETKIMSSVTVSSMPCNICEQFQQEAASRPYAQLLLGLSKVHLLKETGQLHDVILNTEP